MLMCIQLLVKFCPLVLKILSGNEMVTELRNNGIAEGRKDRANQIWGPIIRLTSTVGLDVIEIIHFFHFLLFGGSRGCCLNIKALPSLKSK